MKQIINNSDTGLVARTIINENFSEVYQSLYDNTRVYVSGESVIIDNSGFKEYLCNATTAPGESPITTPAKWDIVGDGVGDMLLAGIQSVIGLKTFDKDKLAIKGIGTGVVVVTTANTGATSYTATLQAKDGTLAFLTDANIYIPATEPALATGVLTLDCNGSQEAMFEPRLSVGALTINTNFSVVLINSVNTKLIGNVYQFTGTVIITFATTAEHEFKLSIAPNIGIWDSIAKTLTISAGTDDIIEIQLERYNSPTLPVWLIKAAEPAT